MGKLDTWGKQKQENFRKPENGNLEEHFWKGTRLLSARQTLNSLRPFPKLQISEHSQILPKIIPGYIMKTTKSSLPTD